MQVILEKLSQWADMPYVIMGDLNAEPDAPEMAPLFAALQDTCKDKAFLTFPSDHPTIKIDHILFRGEWNLLDVYSIDTQNSDHRPLIAKMELA